MRNKTILTLRNLYLIVGCIIDNNRFLQKASDLLTLIKPPAKFLYGLVLIVRNYRMWISFLLHPIPKGSHAHVFYGYMRIPKKDELLSGGMVKFQRLEEYFPNSTERFNTLYLGSSSLPKEWQHIIWLAKQKKVRLVLNQNGVMYPRHGTGWEQANIISKKILHRAEYVFYQSRFCKYSADKFLGKRSGAWEILYNCVDTSFFSPQKKDNSQRGGLSLLLGGNQYEWYRLDVALETVAHIAHEIKNVRLLITGDLNWISDGKKAYQLAHDKIRSLGIENNVEFIGAYIQKNAPQIYNRADILLHTKHNDPCPGLVIEAMSCGLPVVSSKSGGVPELVGEDAGVCIPVETGWDKEIRPSPKILADAIQEVVDKLKDYSHAARQRAVDYFDIKPWVRRHQEVFTLLSQS